MNQQSPRQSLIGIVIGTVLCFAGVFVTRELYYRFLAPPPPPPPSVEGSFILYSVGNIFELPSGPNSGKAIDFRIAGPNISSAKIYLDKHYLIYSRNSDSSSEVYLHDLRTGEVKTLFLGPHSSCISWSPDFSFINYVTLDYSLYVYDVAAGKSTLIYAAPSANYGYIVYGHVSCGDWIGPDRFVFSRFVGPMPFEIPDGTRVLPTNITTLAILDESVALVDSPQLLYMHHISDDQKHLLVTKEKSLYYGSLPTSFNDFDSLDLSVIVTRDSTVRNVTLTSSEVAYEDNEYQIHFVNLGNFQEDLGPKIPDYWQNWICGMCQ
jgi:WD40 repeat protein